MKRERKRKGNAFMKILGGSFLSQKDYSRTFPFLVYVTILLMLIITNTYIAESTSRSIKNNTRRLRELRVEYIYAKSLFIRESAKPVMINKVKDMGIKKPDETLVIKTNN